MQQKNRVRKPSVAADVKGITLITDPFDKSTGLKVPSLEADIVTVSHDHADHNNIKAIKGSPFVISSAGEYDYKDVGIVGVQAYHDGEHGKARGSNVIYRIEIDDISIAHLGDLAHTLDNEQLEILAGTDILLIPVGGKSTLDAKKAVEVISQIEPRIVIPMHYNVPGLTFTDLDGVDKFIREIGVQPTEEERLKISKKDLPVDEMKVVILKM